MTDNNYPPLPRPAWDKRTICTTGDAYTEHQMRAYINADRAQRKPLTDEQCDAISKALNEYYDHWEFGPPKDDEEERDGVRQAIREALNPPPRPDAGNN